MNQTIEYINKSPISVAASQTVIDLNGDRLVLMGRICKTLGLKDSVGMGVIRKSPASFDRHKVRVTTNGTPGGTPLVAIPVEKLDRWLMKICPVFSGDSKFASDVRTYQQARRSGAKPKLPEDLAKLLTDSRGQVIAFPELVGAFDASPLPGDSAPVKSQESERNSRGPTMSSREIAELAGKQHKHVMADIRSMCDQLGIDSAEFSAQYRDSTGRSLPCFELDRYHTEVLVTGYDVQRRAAVIKRWHDLESGRVQPAAAKQASRAELILQQAQALVEHERRLEELEREQEEQRQKMRETECQLRAIAEGEEYFTVSAYCNLQGRPVPSEEAASMGRAASRICEQRGWTTGKAPHPRFGSVKTYPRQALEIVIPGKEVAK